MIPALLDELKRLEQEASPAPWLVEHCDYALGTFIDDVFIAAFRSKARALIEAVETMHAALVRCGRTPLKPKGTWPTSEEIYQDRLERVGAAQKALARVAELLGEGQEIAQAIRAAAKGDRND